MDYHIVNAKIARIEIKMTSKREAYLFLDVDYGGSFQGVTLSLSRLSDLMNVVEVTTYDALRGCPIRVKSSDRMIVAIWNYLKDLEFVCDLNA